MSSALTRALTLFDEYADLPATRRREALARLKQHEPATHARLIALLAADDDLSALEESPFAMLHRWQQTHGLGRVADPAADPRIGTRLGPWEIDRVIGMGGMGAVYEAHRADGQYEQSVALKCLRTELISPRLVEAFRHERSTLARLEHPNIARLLDGGVDDHGHPWFAMQKVNGHPIDRWCDRQRLTLHERVRLLLQACTAVAHAHGHNVLHQDIKPSNLLVTEDGQPILLDFGLAQWLSCDNAQERRRIAISNGYAAPEAWKQTRPGPGTDIYAMGVVLYRLLCADWPVRFQTMPSAQPFEQLESAIPRAPSLLALQITEHAARSRGETGNRALSRRLSGDLDSIALRCVATDPANRYRSIDELQTDLQRWLQRQPVTARNGGHAYRLRRFLQRNALATVLGAVTLLTTGTLVGFGLWQIRHAQQEALLAQTLAALFRKIPDGAELPEWGQIPLNTPASLDRSESGLRNSTLRGDRRIMARGLLSLARGHMVIGDSARSLALIDEAKRTDAREYARAQSTLARLLNLQARHGQAEQAAREGVKALGMPLSDDAKSVLAALYAEIARARWQSADRKTALGLLGDTLQAVESSPHRYPPELRTELLTLRGDWHNQRLKFPDGKADAERALALSAASPGSTAGARETLAASLRESGDAHGALEVASSLLGQQQRRYGLLHPETGLAWITLAETQQAAGQPGKALASSQQALRILIPVLGNAHPHIARALRIGALARTFTGAHQEAVADARRAVTIMETAYGGRNEQSIRARQALALSLGYLSETSTSGRPYLDEALSQYTRLLSDGEALGLPMGRQWLAYGIRLGNSGHVRQASQALQRALPMLEQEYGADSDYFFEARRSQATLLLKEGRHSEARQALENFAARLRAPRVNSLYRSAALSDTLLELAHLDLVEGNSLQSRRHLEEALRISTHAFGAEDPQVRAIQRAIDKFASPPER